MSSVLGIRSYSSIEEVRGVRQYFFSLIVLQQWNLRKISKTGKLFCSPLVKTQNGKVMARDLPPLMVNLKAFRETYSEDIRGVLSGLDSDFRDEIHPSLR
ncbi:fimbrin-1-like [Pyrus ussuriensis x Pyrus communis]|uniref:Fimbrin-1-like n=1 Tax=Pyrus ussuriensis x Pyrus communis TaxID=2448454 RepID=A0A5N5IC48_9ROSA|nr:fimbrin-1-like [Pyrus ussuriensis x Pyrus communis]